VGTIIAFSPSSKFKKENFMMENWQKAFEELEVFISNHDSIEISSKVVSIPGELRPDFYRLFNAVRASFAKDRFPNYIEDAYELSRNYLEVKNRVCSRLGLTNIELSPQLNWLINDPVDGLIHEVFNTVYDLLKRKIDLAKFEAIADAAISNTYSVLSRDGYNRWITLALLEDAAPDAGFVSLTEDVSTEPGLSEGALVPGHYKASPPRIEPAQRLSFYYTTYTALLVPSIIIHSTRSNCFVSLRTDYHMVYRRAPFLNEDNEWIKTDKIWKDYGRENLWPDLGIYTNTTAEALAVVSDYNQIARPDIIVECKEKADWFKNGDIQSVLRHYYVMQPRQGSFIVCREPVPDDVLRQLGALINTETEAPVKASKTSAPIKRDTEETPKETYPGLQPLPSDIHILVAGYDSSKLEPIIKTIMTGCSETPKGINNQV
jgi:hypothetical protein